jgi:uncharacterized protein (TIGR03437 family)
MLNRGSSLAVCLGLLSSAGAFGQQYKIATLAGNGAEGFADGSDLTAVQFNTPNALTIDSKGAIYIADTGGHRIRLLSGGSVSTVAGNGTAGYTGGGAPTSISIWSPGGIAVAGDGTFYIAETTNHVVRKVSGSSISVYAGSALAGYSGDTGQANVAQVNAPTGLAFDSAGNLYISDTGNNLIRRVDKNNIITSYVGGTGPTAGSLQSPTGICFDAAGGLYIADNGHNRIAKFVASATSLTTVAGNGEAGFSGDGGPARSAKLNHPNGCAVDAAGNLYIADTNNSRIRKVTTDGNIFTIAGNGGIGYFGDGGNGTSAGLNFPRGVAVGTDGKVYIADTGNSVIRVLTATVPAVAGVTNAASNLQRVSPGALATIYGSAFGEITAQGEYGFLTNALPTSLSGVSVTVNGSAAPLLFISPAQINFQVPWKTTASSSGTAAVAVVINGGSSNAFQVPLQTAAPGLFTYNGGLPVVVNNDDSNLNDAGHPAAVGSTIIAYLTGSGPLSVAVADGTPTPNSPLANITAAKSAKIGTIDATVSFGGLAPGFVGLVQFNIVVPAGLSPGAYPLTITIDGQTSNPGNIVVK